MTGYRGLMSAAGRLASVGVAATIGRYRLEAPYGGLFLIGAVFDPFVYAGVVYFVLTTVFQPGAPERFHILLIGFIAFRWAVASLVGCGNVAGVARRMAESGPFPIAAAVAAAMAPPTLAFLLSLVAAYAFSLLVGASGHSVVAAGWLPFVVFVQGVWTAALILALTVLRRGRPPATDAPVLVVASLLWMLSPVMYTFRDIPPGASKLLTSYNPVSHLLAAYQNAYWYGQPVSLEVLPAAAVAGVLVIAVLRGVLARRLADSGPVLPPWREARPRLVFLLSAPPPGPSRGEGMSARRFTPWRERFKDLRGRDLVRMIVAAREDRRAAQQRLAEIRETSAVGRLFDDYLAIYPDRVLDQLAFAAALRSPARAIVLDGILDAASDAFLARAWALIETECAAGRAITVICRRPLHLPAQATGGFEILAGPDTVAQGDIGPDLDAAYRRFASDTPPAGEPS